MKITAKKIQSMEGRDGTAFSADIYLDNKKVGYIHDEGCGGPLIVEISKEDNDRIEAHLKTLPTATDEWGTDTEVFLSDLVLGILDDRDFKKLFNKLVKRPTFVRPDGKGLGNFPKLKWTPEIKAKLADKFPDYKFLNNMTLDEAKPYLTA